MALTSVGIGSFPEVLQVFERMGLEVGGEAEVGLHHIGAIGGKLGLQ